MFIHAMKMKKEMEAMENEGYSGGVGPVASAATKEGDAVGGEVRNDSAAANDENVELGITPATSKDDKKAQSGEHKVA